MTLEDILYEAEKQGLRLKVLESVAELRQKQPHTPLIVLYEAAWETIKREQRI